MSVQFVLMPGLPVHLPLLYRERNWQGMYKWVGFHHVVELLGWRSD